LAERSNGHLWSNYWSAPRFRAARELAAASRGKPIMQFGQGKRAFFV
jgi:hypothetical protein